jgi:isoleucyl-tRNA synthetase
MYCDAANSPRRRATQAVMHATFDAVVKLLAPVLAYTADEAWEELHKGTSIHVETFPEANGAYRDEATEAAVEEWLKLRAVIYQQAIEPARQTKAIAKSLEAAVTVELPEAQLASLTAQKTELEEFFIVSELNLTAGAELGAKVIKSGRTHCARCWRYDATTGNTKPDLCDRCAQAVS